MLGSRHPHRWRGMCHNQQSSGDRGQEEQNQMDRVPHHCAMQDCITVICGPDEAIESVLGPALRAHARREPAHVVPALRAQHPVRQRLGLNWRIHSSILLSYRDATFSHSSAHFRQDSAHFWQWSCSCSPHSCAHQRHASAQIAQ